MATRPQKTIFDEIAEEKGKPAPAGQTIFDQIASEQKKPVKSKYPPARPPEGWAEKHPILDVVARGVSKPLVKGKSIADVLEASGRPLTNIRGVVERGIEKERAAPSTVVGPRGLGMRKVVPPGKVEAGVELGAAGALDQFATVQNALLAVGLGATAVPQIAKFAVEAGLSVNMLLGALRTYPEIMQKFKSGDVQGGIEALTQTGVLAGAGVGMGKAAFRRARGATAYVRPEGEAPVHARAEEIGPETRRLPGERQPILALPVSSEQREAGAPAGAAPRTFVGAPGGTVMQGGREYTVNEDGSVTPVIRGRAAAGELGTVPTRPEGPEMPPTELPTYEGPRQIKGLPETPGGAIAGKIEGVPGGIRTRREQTITPIPKAGQIRPPVRPESKIYGYSHPLPALEELKGLHPDTLDHVRYMVSGRLAEIEDLFSKGAVGFYGFETGTKLVSPDTTEGLRTRQARVHVVSGIKDLFPETRNIDATPKQIAEVIKNHTGKSKLYDQVVEAVTKSVLEDESQRISDYDLERREREAIETEQKIPLEFGAEDFAGEEGFIRLKGEKPKTLFDRIEEVGQKTIDERQESLPGGRPQPVGEFAAEAGRAAEAQRKTIFDEMAAEVAKAPEGAVSKRTLLGLEKKGRPGETPLFEKAEEQPSLFGPAKERRVQGPRKVHYTNRSGLQLSHEASSQAEAETYVRALTAAGARDIWIGEPKFVRTPTEKSGGEKLPEGVTFIGTQKGFGDIPDMKMYNDAKAKNTTIAVKPGESLMQKVRDTRAKFGVADDITLYSTFIPGLDVFIDKNLVPAAKRVAEWSGGLGRAAVNAFFPRIGVPKAALDIVYQMKGDRDMNMFFVQARFEKAAKDFSKMAQPEQVDFIDRYKRRLGQNTPELTALDAQYRGLENEIYQALQQYKPDLPYKENHFRVMWKKVPGDLNDFRSNFYDKMTGGEQTDFLNRFENGVAQPTPELERYAQFYRGKGLDLRRIFGRPIGRIAKVMAPFRRRPILGSQTFKYKSTLADMSEGIALGGEPHTYNPQRMLEMAINDDLKFVTAKRMGEALKNAGLMKFIREGAHPPEGFAKFNDPMAEVYYPVKGKGMVHAGEWFVEENTARILNNFISRDFLRDPSSGWSFLGRPAMWVKNQMTAFELGFSAFHLSFEGLESMSSDVGLGLRKAWNLGVLQRRPGMIKEGLKTIAGAPLAPFGAGVRKLIPGARPTTFEIGAGLVKYVKDPAAFRATPEGQALFGLHPDLDRILTDMFRGGARLSIHEDYKLRSIEGFNQALADMRVDPLGGAARGALHALPALNNLIMQPLFEKFIPRLKAGMFVKEFSTALLEKEADLMSGRMTRVELARKTWDFVEDRLGEMNFDNLFWNRTLKTGLQFTMRSVTWKWGNLRASGGALPEQAREAVRALRESRVPQLEPKLAWLLGMSVFTAALGSIIQTAYTGKPPENGKDLIYPRMDDKDESQRFAQPTYWRDIMSFFHAPLNYLTSSMSSEISRTAELMRNQDFYGNEVYDPYDPAWQEAIDILKNYTPVPFSVTSGARLAKEGEGISKAVPGALGFTKAPAYITMSAATLRSRELARTLYPRAARPKSYGQAAKKRAELAQLFQRDPAKYDEELEKALESGELSSRDVPLISKRVGEPELLRNVKRLGAREAINIYANDATADERLMLQEVIANKLNSASFERLSKEQKNTLKTMLKSLGWDVEFEQ